MTFDIMYDYDDIVVEMVPALHRKAHELGLHDNSVPHLSTWAGHEQYGCEEDEWWGVFDHLMAEGWYYNTPAAQGIKEGMERLKAAGHRIHILTARGFMNHADEIRKATYKNIEHLELPVDTITFNRNKVQGMIEALGGWTRLQPRPQFDFAIDDGAHNYEHLDDAGVRVYLLELPHNEEWRWYHPTARTVKSVDDYVDLILKES
jgi:hypothetical protein